MDFVKVVILGTAGVGKTSVVQRFVYNEFDENYLPTGRKETYYPNIIIHDHLYEVKILDVPVIPYFPLDSFGEWADFRFYGLRNATAYILVFDLSNMDTFQFVRKMREQILESRDMKRVPLIIVGNKHDLVGGEVPSGAAPVLLPPGADASQRKRRDIVNLVRKHWKCTYVECSARHNWGVVSVFKELMDVLDSMDCSRRSEKEAYAPMMDDIQEAFDGNKCVVS